MAYAKLIAAAQFAAKKHVRQRRKDLESSPYVNHPVEVANLLANEAGVDDVDLLIAAFLHDTLEDTLTSQNEILSNFGSRVLSIVMEVTDDKSLSKLERKRLQVETAPHKSDEAKQLKIADKICNIRDLDLSSPIGWDAEQRNDYLNWSARVVLGCRGVNEQLDQLFEIEYVAAQKRIGAAEVLD